MRCSTLRGTFCSLITLATPRQDWTGSNPSRRKGGGCGFTLSRSHSCCAVRLLYTQISPGHIWTTLYFNCRCYVKVKAKIPPSTVIYWFIFLPFSFSYLCLLLRISRKWPSVLPIKTYIDLYNITKSNLKVFK